MRCIALKDFHYAPQGIANEAVKKGSVIDVADADLAGSLVKLGYVEQVKEAPQPAQSTSAPSSDAGWSGDEKPAGAFVHLVKQLAVEPVFLNGDDLQGLSPRFLALLTLLRAEAGVLPEEHLQVGEARKLLAGESNEFEVDESPRGPIPVKTVGGEPQGLPTMEPTTEERDAAEYEAKGGEPSPGTEAGAAEFERTAEQGQKEIHGAAAAAAAEEPADADGDETENRSSRRRKSRGGAPENKGA